MMRKAIFLDRDGTLVVDPGYVHKLEDFKLHDGVIEALQKLKDFKLFIITNQSGIGRGIYKEKDMYIFNSHLLKILDKENIKIERIFFCPHSPDQECECRKPSKKLLSQALNEFGIDPVESWVIGDHDVDVQLGKNLGCKTVYLLTGHGVKHLKETRALNPDYIAANIKQAADYVNFKEDRKIIPREKLLNQITFLKSKKKKIVTVNGTFDILHKGHEYILQEAKKQGDVLIVGLNSDSSVKLNKGPDRPLNNEFRRAKMLANFEHVDYITIFSEKTPIDLLKIIRPNVHVNGSDYGEDCIEAKIVKKFGGKIHIVRLVAGYSTTSIISS